MELKKEELHIVLHSLGWSHIRWYEKEKINEKSYRNYFYTNKDTVDYPFIESLIDKGIMSISGKGWDSDSAYFSVTDKGISCAREHLKGTIKRPSRSKARYQLYLHCECDESFGEWLKNSYWDDYRKRYGVS